MNKSEVVKEWIAALKSDNYNQGYRKLRTKEEGEREGQYSYCCLGVLGEVIPNVEWDGELNLVKDRYQFTSYFAFPPSEVTQELLLSIELKEITSKEELVKWITDSSLKYKKELLEKFDRLNLSSTLVSLNDSGLVKFSEIADFLERFFLPYIERTEDENTQDLC